MRTRCFPPHFFPRSAYLASAGLLPSTSTSTPADPHLHLASDHEPRAPHTCPCYHVRPSFHHVHHSHRVNLMPLNLSRPLLILASPPLHFCAAAPICRHPVPAVWSLTFTCYGHLPTTTAAAADCRLPTHEPASPPRHHTFSVSLAHLACHLDDYVSIPLHMSSRHESTPMRCDLPAPVPSHFWGVSCPGSAPLSMRQPHVLSTPTRRSCAIQ